MNFLKPVTRLKDLFAGTGMTSRLALGFGLVLVLFIGTAGMTATQLHQLDASLTQVGNLNRDFVVRTRAMRDAIGSAYLFTTAATRAQNKDDLKFYLDSTRQDIAAYEKLKNELAGLTADYTRAPEPMLKPLANLKDVESVMIILNGMLRRLDDVLKDTTTEKFSIPGSIESELTDMKPQLDYWLKALKDSSDGAVMASNSGFAQAKGSVATSSRVMLVATAIAVLISIAAAWLIARSVTRPIRMAVDVAEQVAIGDLSHQILHTRRDETGALLDALGRMQGGLHALVADVRESVNTIEQASSEVASGNFDLSQRTEQTASELQRTAGSMGTLTDSVQRSTELAQDASRLAQSAAAAAERGGDVVAGVVSNMNDIAGSSRKVGDIVAVIEGIAFQTNILALNAAVEAARAGEQGRGFAVVASEVRTLAQRAASSAKDIKGLIGASVEKVESGSKLVHDAGRTMSEIVSSVQQVTAIIGEISLAASSQSEGILEVGGAIGQLEAMTQQNAALVEQNAAAAESLKSQTLRLTEMVSAFRLREA